MPHSSASHAAPYPTPPPVTLRHTPHSSCNRSPTKRGLPASLAVCAVLKHSAVLSPHVAYHGSKCGVPCTAKCDCSSECASCAGCTWLHVALTVVLDPRP
eukprot:365033-Chlamydomonas_euryale.AAC.3